MRKFEIRKGYAQVKLTNRRDIKPGVTICTENTPTILGEYETLEMAKDDFCKYCSRISYTNKIYEIEEYYIEENEYDEDGSFVEHYGVWEISPMKINVETTSRSVLASFDNYESAEHMYYQNDMPDDIQIVLY